MSVLSRLLSDMLFGARKVPSPPQDNGPGALAKAAEHLRSGRTDQALALCTQVAERDSTNPAALHMKGAIMAQRGEYQPAEESLRLALALDPHRTDAWVDLGSVLRLRDSWDEALACYARALEIDSRHVLAAYGQSQVLAQSGRASKAIDALQARVVLDYDPLLLRALVALLVTERQFETARQLCEQALVRNPDHPEAHSGLGYLALTQDQDAGRALAHFDRAVASISADADLLSNRGIALQELGRVDQALACYEHALSVDGQHHSARVHRALALLAKGDYRRGWEEFEYRRFDEEWGTPPDGVAEWQGEDLGGKSIYVYAEQGIGDELLFASCLPDLLRSAGKVMIECDPRLVAIFARSFPDAAVFDRAERLTGANSPRRAGADLMVPMGSLPRHLRIDLRTFPRHGAYLRPNAELVATLRARLAQLKEPLKVGVSWRGGTARTWGNRRSIALRDLLPLLQIPGIDWVSVQYGDVSAEIADLHARYGIRVWESPEVLGDYEQTAALACALDLVVSVQTAVVNLCGALARPVWVAVPVNPHWRYGLQGESMPWFSSVRVMRQAVADDWTGVITHMAQELRAFTRGTNDSLPIAAI